MYLRIHLSTSMHFKQKSSNAVYVANDNSSLIQYFVYFAAVSKDRVHRIVQHFAKHGTCPENRGGAWQSTKYNVQKESIKAHIEKFSCKASHYGRRGKYY